MLHWRCARSLLALYVACIGFIKSCTTLVCYIARVAFRNEGRGHSRSGGRCFAQIDPELVDSPQSVRLGVGRHRVRAGRIRLKSDQAAPMLGQIRPTWAEVARNRPNLGRFRPNVGPDKTKFDRFRPGLDQFGPMLARFDCPDSTKVGLQSARFHQPKITRTLPTSTSLGPNSGIVDTNWPRSAKLGPESTNVCPTSVERGPRDRPEVWPEGGRKFGQHRVGNGRSWTDYDQTRPDFGQIWAIRGGRNDNSLGTQIEPRRVQRQCTTGAVPVQCECSPGKVSSDYQCNAGAVPA